VAKWLKCANPFFLKLSMSVPKQLQTQLSTKWQGYMLEITREGAEPENKTTEYHRSFVKKHIERFQLLNHTTHEKISTVSF
jgi:hypothetical protein